MGRFEKLFALESEYQRLVKRRDEMFAEEDVEDTGFRLATVLSQITRIEKEIKELRHRTPVSSN